MLEWFAAWYNWPFLFTFLVGMGLVAVSLLGVGKDADGGDADVAIAKPDAPATALGFLGVGRAPVIVLLQTLLVTFGLTGLFVNAVGRDLLGGWSGAVFPLALVAAAAGSIAACNGVARVLSRWAPSDQPTSNRSGQFVGSPGQAVTLITQVGGQAKLDFDRAIPDAIVHVRAADEWPHPIERGTEVVLVRYDAPLATYFVVPRDRTPSENET